jgi:hypothetical protein
VRHTGYRGKAERWRKSSRQMLRPARRRSISNKVKSTQLLRRKCKMKKKRNLMKPKQKLSEGMLYLE